MSGDILRVQLTGQVSLLDAGGTSTRAGGRQAQVLLAMLALQEGQVSVEAVAEVLWGEALSPHWRGALRGIVSKLRRVLVTATGNDHPLSVSHGIIRLEVDGVDDVSRAEELISVAGGGTLGADEVDELRQLALRLPHPFLVHNDSAWADGQRRRIEALADRAEHAVLAALRADDRIDEAIGWAEHIVARNPVDVVARENLIELFLEASNAAAAQRSFAELSQMLATEFGVAPDPKLSARVRSPEPRRLDISGQPALRRHPFSAEPFVARDDPLTSIRTAWKRVQQSARPELVLVRGTAGVGKSRLADRALEELDPPQQLWGRARPAGGHSWGPIADALADVFTRNAALAHAATIGFPTIGRLLPGLESSGPNEPSAPTEDTAPRDAALTVARRIIDDILAEPTILVIDDLQWTNLDGLALIESVLVDTDGPLLVIATCREVPTAVAEVLATVARQIAVTDIHLDVFDIAELTELTRQHSPSVAYTADSIALMHRRTGGLPFFACTLLRDARRHGVDIEAEAVPESVSVWLENHLKTLSDDQRRILEIVAVFGTGADLPGIETIVEKDPIAVADTLDELTVAGLVTIDAQGRIRIPHDLTLWSVWGSIGRARRATLHRLVGDHLDRSGAPAARVAAHWSLAGHARHEHALDAHLRAGDIALGQGAWRAALEHFEKVADEAEDPEAHVTALIGSGRALIQLRNHDEARQMLEAAADLAAHHGIDHAMAEATLVLVGRAGRGAIVDDETSQLMRLRAARDRLAKHTDLHNDSRTSVLLSRLETELSIAMMFTGSLSERTQLMASALERVRSTPGTTPNDLARALLGPRLARLDPTALRTQIAELDEVLALPHAKLDAEVLISAHLYRHEDLLRAGRRAEADADLVMAREIAAEVHHSYWLWAVATWEALERLLDGDLDAAEAGFAEAVSTRAHVAEALACQQVNLVGLRLVQHRGDEMIGPLRTAVAAYPQIPTWRAALALASIESGDIGTATSVLDEFTAERFASLPEDTNRLFALGILAHVAAGVGSTAAATMLWDLLEPYRGQLVLLNVYGGAGACWGPLDWALATIAPLIGRCDSDVRALWTSAFDGATATMPVLTERIAAEAAAAGFPIELGG